MRRTQRNTEEQNEKEITETKISIPPTQTDITFS